MFSYAIETNSFVGSRIWNSIPSEVKESSLLEEFSAKIGR